LGPGALPRLISDYSLQSTQKNKNAHQITGYESLKNKSA
jgi:hypothetical protein